MLKSEIKWRQRHWWDFFNKLGCRECGGCFWHSYWCKWRLPEEIGRVLKHMAAMSPDNGVGLTVLRCWHCGHQEQSHCWHCDNTGHVFWVSGYAYPYTPDGWKRAKEWSQT